MRYFQKIWPLILLVGMTVMQSCGENKTIIKEDKLSRIIGEMYLADQYIEQSPQYRAQTDTMRLYDAIFRKYGYTGEDYRNSVEYYLKKGNTYKKIHYRAKEILQERENELKKILEIQSGIPAGWWASDSVKTIPVQFLEKDPYLRSVKWILLWDAPVEWEFFRDSAITDIPQNIYWWKNNTELVTGKVLKRQMIRHIPVNHKKKEKSIQKQMPPGKRLIPDSTIKQLKDDQSQFLNSVN